MKYTMKSGTLYSHNHSLASIKGILTGPEKRIYSADGTLLLQTSIQSLEPPAKKGGDVRFRKYLLSDKSGNPYATARPDYAHEDDPELVGWPVCRMPKTDRAKVQFQGEEYLLFMQNSQNYFLKKISGENVIQIFHRNLAGGWDIEAADGIAPEIICGIFVFCRYIERENEFPIV